ncbi:MAG: hypothetical protein COW11_02405 [Candidatus Omnitrophica bacterium CG12_big_fil_rev_8_21_14_0_65_43_15]|uniref:Carbohydrate binding domain-containing protein n=1 Tax=Candidatus Taenaricola geysiri TaxID=1974752 RepID=A0A2J0LFJ0_9BACT|nr:MAG: hypothetical protein AUJ89_01475 [Candidatus Omnitrophica bacterium CG1_02_43_210]PIR65606.1 MAG: hypothetical protein COU52_03350 [Candidatus Omnitrophica bacterium CG10_big_fil_rev_8_21_14_0_10_43_8]PIV11960.1 MAG: hypothetical protein COS48_03295 [Candidatus Omnitrophica bacterium CG03_land_8_20_14_0_80_43_22]PIW66612.1 MAG: hypothetical protein COW11_02405 [Candidatus Omnitrophica bacterium CG12_big_fil_rev_8_21_14_0_65_43_15]PIW80881.1 MAG: hypothetical protein COZ98_00340 [Candida
MKKILLIASVFILLFSSVVYAKDAAQVFLLDDFEKAGNLVGGKSNTYEKEPSKSLAMRVSEEFYGNAGRSLMIKFDKKSEGGLYGTGGWCGYYTMLRSGAKYFDITPYKTLTFQVKGVKGDENFKIGLADRHWEELGDSVKSEDVVKYIPTGKITTEWQKAVVPLDVFFLDKKEVSSLAFCFESESFATGSAKGTVYIDDLRLE